MSVIGCSLQKKHSIDTFCRRADLAAICGSGFVKLCACATYKIMFIILYVAQAVVEVVTTEVI